MSSVRQRGTCKCRNCGELGHFTKLCLNWQGRRFGMLLVLRGAPPQRRPGPNPPTSCVWCKCDCGTEKAIPCTHLHRGRVSSCGCSRLRASKSNGLLRVTAPETVTVFGEEMTLGCLATAAGKRPDQIYARMRAGKSPEEAAFGAGAMLVHPLPPRAAPPTLPRRVDPWERALSSTVPAC